MRLSLFINGHIEQILAEWESFAKTLLPAAADMSAWELRDHARLILKTIVEDLETDQTAQEEESKSKGEGPEAVGDESAASTHGTLRQHSGFTLLQLTAEYRAVRASVLRLWLREVSQVTDDTSNDMLRFNEAIDHALAESVVMFSDGAAQTRDTFLAILGHDLRSPLHSMVLAGDYLTRPEVENNRRLQVGRRVKRSAATMTTMVNDLLEYARTQLGGKMPIEPQQADMGEICQSAVEDASASHPDCPFELDVTGELVDYFDIARMHQVFANLLNNAAQYRSKEHPVTISAGGERDEVTARVRNFGPVIPPQSFEAIFRPLVQLPLDARHGGRPSTSVGLGLLIAREITVAHGGTLTVESGEASGTIFTVRLPRMQPVR